MADPAMARSGDSAGIFEAIYDLTGVEYMGGPPQTFELLSIDAGVQILRFRWDDVVLQTFDNTGIPNWGSEAYLGLTAYTEEGDPSIFMAQPFPDAFGGGTFGPSSGAIELELENVFADPDGLVPLMVASAWLDGTGLPAGEYLSGTIAIEYTFIPAPATLALALMSIGHRRRRRPSA